MANQPLRLSILLAVALLAAGCGNGDEPNGSGGSSAPTLPESACADLGLATKLARDLGGKAKVLSEKVTEDGDTSVAHCVWSVSAPEISTDGATVDLVIQAGAGSQLSEEYRTATELDVAPPDWRPATRIETTEVTPKGQWDEASGHDYSHPIAGANATRLLSVRVGRGDGFVARVAVRMDAKGTKSAAPATAANKALAAAPALFK